MTWAEVGFGTGARTERACSLSAWRARGRRQRSCFVRALVAATKAELQTLAGYWPAIEKSRAEARRLLKEAGAEGLAFELLNRNVDQPYKFVGTWLIDEWSKIAETKRNSGSGLQYNENEGIGAPALLFDPLDPELAKQPGGASNYKFKATR